MLPNSVTSIGKSAFAYCSGLSTIIIPNSVTSIGNSAFYGCSGLSSITIPNSVTYIDEKAFYACSSLASVTFDSNVYIYNYAFGDTPLQKVYCNAESVQAVLSMAFRNTSGSTSSARNATLYVPTEMIEAYKSTVPWKEFGTITSVEIETQVNKFKADNITILSKTTENVAVTDLNAINKAIDDYSKLSDAAKAKFTEEKALLDALKTKAEELKAEEECPPDEGNKCTEPQITFSDKTLTLSCATPDADIHYSYYLSNVGTVKSTKQIPAVTKTTNALTVIAYATAEGLKQSTTVIQTFPFDATAYDVNGDNKLTITDVTTLIDVIVNQ